MANNTNIPFELRIKKPNAKTIDAIDDVNNNCSYVINL